QGTVAISGCTFANNSASSTSAGAPYGYGGAIANRYNAAHNRLVTITNSTFSSNSATVGGVIDNYGIVQINDSTFNGNVASQNGGALEDRIGGNMTVVDSTIVNNTSQGPTGGTGKGGGIRNLGTLTVVNSTITGNAAVSVGGGGISQHPSYGSAT